MKKIKFSLFALMFVLALSACEDADDNGLSEQARVQQVLDRLKKNEGINHQIFGLLGERLSADSLEELRKLAGSREAFINLVARQTDDYFEEIVEKGSSSFDVTAIPTPFAGEAEITLKGLASTQAAGAGPFDVIGAYSKHLLQVAKDQSDKGHKDWIVIDVMGTSNGTAAEPLPAESLSLNYTKVEFLASVPHTIIMDTDLTDEEMLTEVSDVLHTNGIPPVAIALLVPAVQRFQNPSEEQPFPQAMNAWLNGPVTQAINGGLNRDIIRRIHAAVYLAALQTILLDGYQGTNPDVASLSLMHARYRAAVIMGAREMWQD